MRSEATLNRVSSRMHQHYQEWFVGTGTQTEFFLAHTLFREDDVMVFLDGVLQRPDLRGTVRDFKIRGLTPGYGGDSNAIRFAVAPLAGVDINVAMVSS